MMRRRYPDTHFIMISEEDALCATRKEFGERDWRIQIQLIDVLLKLIFFKGITEPVTTDEGKFQSYAYPQYAQLPQTLLSVYELWRKAYYVEAGTLSRHLYEVFIQLRYFKKHPDKVMKHVTAKTQKDRVPFRTMFDDVAPDSYKAVYGMLSGFAHGNQNMIFRTDIAPASATQPEPMQYPFAGSKFNETYATVMHIFFTSVALGFFNYFGDFFPKNILSTDAEFSQDVTDAQEWLRFTFDNQRKKATKPELFDALEKLVIV